MMLIEWKGCGAMELIGREKQRRGVVKSGRLGRLWGQRRGADAFDWKEITALSQRPQ